MLILLLFLLVGGCAARQDISQFAPSNIPQNACIAKHDAVRAGVLKALQDGFRKHGVQTRVIQATYTQKHGLWQPQVSLDQLNECDVIVFYVANWTWDIAMYMYFANIWITDPGMNNKVAQATYKAGAGPSKWRIARKKIIELVDKLFNKNIIYSKSGSPLHVKPGRDNSSTEVIANTHKEEVTSTKNSGTRTKVRLIELKGLYDEGLITEEEYKAQKARALNM